MSRLLVAACMTVGVGAAPAHDGALRQGAQHPGQEWDFTLPTLDGSRFVQASALSGPVLVNFWGKDCAPCIAELPRLQAFAKANPQWTVLLVSTDVPADARAFVQRHGVQLTVLRSGASVAGLMRSAGNRSGGLPFTVALQDARICHRHIGEVGEAELAAITSACH
jgi:thiol-disulfide isomerase/thioredoxin